MSVPIGSTRVADLCPRWWIQWLRGDRSRGLWPDWQMNSLIDLSDSGITENSRKQEVGSSPRSKSAGYDSESRPCHAWPKMLPASLCFLDAMKWVASNTPFHHNLLPHHWPRHAESTMMCRLPLKSFDKLIPPFKFLPQISCYSGEQLLHI